MNLGAGFARNPISRRALAPVCGARTEASALRLMGRNLLRKTKFSTFAEQSLLKLIRWAGSDKATEPILFFGKCDVDEMLKMKRLGH